MKCLWVYCVLFLGGMALAYPLRAQIPDSLHQHAPRVFLDCPTSFCDLDYIRTEVAFVNYVRDPAQAEVYVLLTTQSTGSGGTEYTLTFQGRRRFAGLYDTLRFSTPPQAPVEVRRRELAHRLRLGLVRYAARTPVADQLRLTYTVPSAHLAAARVRDRWNNWVFRVSLNGYLNAEQQTRTNNYSASLSAQRITPDWKITFQLSYSQGESRFNLGERQVRSVSWNQNVNALLVSSLGAHWSAGGFLNLTRSTYRNLNANLSAQPAIEYNLFPYAEATRRQLRILYRTGPIWNRYREETLFGKTEEGLWAQSLTIATQAREPWGSINASIEGGHYFHDLSKRRLTLFGSMDLRLREGLSLTLAGNFSWIRDQITLPRRGATAEEILLRQRQLATNYSYWISVGLTYTFGAIYNNVVNPRFGSSGGGGVMIIVQ
jgi:hypothetical protein|nr:MAG: hypothetical protein KatS3mg041_0833 [Bacteroidota bacterium]